MCASAKALNTPVLLRNYTYDGVVDMLNAADCSIRQAARATSAATTFFDPIKIGNQEYVDGATGHNNPVEVVLQEASSVWPGMVSNLQCIVSIGIGVPGLENFGNNLKAIVRTLKNIATETEETARKFDENTEALRLKGRYFRFNVDHGMAKVDLEEYRKFDEVESATFRYLQSTNVQTTIAAFCDTEASSVCA